MKTAELERLAHALAQESAPAGVTIVKRSPVRVAARCDDVFIKVFPRRPQVAAREARNLERAHRRGLPVPEVLGFGDGWIATRLLHERRDPSRDDVDALLALSQRAHDSGLVHGDLHVGNFLWSGQVLYLLDLQRARFLPFVPRWLRLRDLGFLAYSLGEPLPPPLEPAGAWCRRRAQTHWRSRTKRCTQESSGFTRWEYAGAAGFRRREVEAARLGTALQRADALEPFKQDSNGALYRCDAWILKRHGTPERARAAWIGGHGLEMRGIATGRALAWVGPWLVMEDAGETLIDWIERAYPDSGPSVRAELEERLAELLACLHRRGIYHADLKANNIAWQPGARPRLLDYGRVRFGRSVSRRRRIKNLAQLNAALPNTVGAQARERVLDGYLAAAETRDSRAALRREVIRLSLERGHRWSGCG
jgi:3-deoxy-D-manno-octulosonic acid kinase